MTANSVAWVVGAAFAGALLGGVFFFGLYWTIRRGLVARQPAAWFLVSLIVRTASVMLGFYWVGGGRWERLLACGCGFLIARFVAGRWVSASPVQVESGTAEARRAS
jgi:F1F0 ATPase subunit 2